MKKVASVHTIALATRTVATDEEPADNALYEEYLRGLDDVPVLRDAVAFPPRRASQPNCRHSERRDLRKEARPDGYSLREANLAALDLLYQEYVAPPPARPKRKKRPKKKRKKS